MDKDLAARYPKISIVTPSFNQGKYLEKTILSVIEQGYPNLEYIIIDGGSRDESVEIIRKYEKHLTYWVSEPDRGQSHAINKGFERATGEIFGWLNSDDWYHPEALRTVAETFAANPEAGAVVGGGDFVDEAGNVIVRTIPGKVTLDTLYSWFDDYFWQPSCFFTRQAWETAGRLDESLHLSMDYDLWLRMARKFTFVTTGKVLSASLKHAEAKTTARLHESDHMTLKLVLRHGGEKAFGQILASYARRLAQFDEGAQQQQESLSQTIKEQQREIRRLNSQLAMVSIQRQKAAENLSRVTKEKEQLLGSLSWKMTRPVRNVLDHVKGHKRNEESESSPQFELFPLGTGRIAPIAFPACQEPLVSIIVPVHNQFPYTWSCLLSILRNTNGIPYEVIVADDASTDRTKGIGKNVRNVTIIRNDPNLGFLKNCNNAAGSARGRYLLFLNNDVNVQADWLKFLLECAESDETVGMVGAKLIYPDGTLQEAGGIVWNDGSATNYGRDDDPSKPGYCYVKEVDYVSGACLLIRRELWERIGGFDDRYVPAYYEDTDLAFEVRKLGYKVILHPKSRVIHFEGKSHGVDVTEGIKSYQVRNKSIFFEKWQETLQLYHAAPGNIYQARDRSLGRKTILFVDYEVPHYDMFAGSRTNYLYLKLLVEMGYNVKLLPANFKGDEPYTGEFNQLGIEVLCGEWFQENWQTWIVENADYLDFVFFNKPEPTQLFIDFIKDVSSARIIYQCHDLHYLRLTRKYEVELHHADYDEAVRYKEMEYEIFKKSDVILTFSSDEKKIIEESVRDKPVVVVPLYFYDKPNESIIDFSNRSGLMYVGGFGHAPNVDAVLWFVKEIFPLVQQQIPDIEFYSVGGNPPAEIVQLNSSNIRIMGQLSDAELKAMYQRVRMVVIPLRYGAGVKGKTIEAMYEGVPLVSTRIGIEGLPLICDAIKSSDTAHGLASDILSTYRNADVLMEMSNKQRAYVDGNLSHDTVKNLLSDVFN